MVVIEKKRRRSTPTTQRSLKWLRDRGYRADTVERVIRQVDAKGKPITYPGTNVQVVTRKDAHGIADVSAFTRIKTLWVQSTTASNVAAHCNSVIEDPELSETVADWIADPNRHYYVHGWRRKPITFKNGKPGIRWHVNVYELTWLANGSNGRLVLARCYALEESPKCRLLV